MVAVTVSISVVTAILLIQKFGATWNVVPVMVFAIIVSTIQGALNRHPAMPSSCKEHPSTEQSPEVCSGTHRALAFSYFYSCVLIDEETWHLVSSAKEPARQALSLPHQQASLTVVAPPRLRVGVQT